MTSLEAIRARIAAACERVGRDPQGVTLVGASKTVEAARLRAFYAAGLRDFGENYVQEGIAKVRAFEEDGLEARWHFIGALQSNKAREVVRDFDLVHSVDRLSLARELDKEAAKIGKRQCVLLQVNLGDEASKAGVAPDELPRLLDAVRAFANLRVEGLMSLPPFHDDPAAMRPYHRQLAQLARDLEFENRAPPTLSMGMSNDVKVAVEEGATIVRVGTALFGGRS